MGADSRTRPSSHIWHPALYGPIEPHEPKFQIPLLGFLVAMRFGKSVPNHPPKNLSGFVSGHPLRKFRYEFVSGHPFTKFRSGFVSRHPLTKFRFGFVSGHRFSDAVKGEILNGFSRRACHYRAPSKPHPNNLCIYSPLVANLQVRRRRQF